MEEKLRRLLSRCQAKIRLMINEHRNDYLTAEEALDQIAGSEISVDVRSEIIKTNTIVELQFYPDTPIGFYYIVHYDLEAALDEAMEILDENRLSRHFSSEEE